MRLAPLPLLSLLLAPAACGAPGERALNGCPVGEVCSPTTPGGLSFAGLMPSDRWLEGGLYPTAVGGSQTVWLYSGGSWDLFQGPYEPVTDVDGIAAARVGDLVQLTATAADDGVLRINAPDGTLYDRIRISSAAAVRMELRAVGERVEAGRTIAVTPGGVQSIVVALLTVDGQRVVDGGLTIEAPRLSSWDGVRVEPAATPVAVRATTSTGITASWTVRSANVVEAVVLQAPGRLPLGAWTTVCATARAGADQLLGQPWRFEVTPTDADLRAAATLDRNCIDIAPRRAGAVPLTATAGTRSAVLMLDVGSSAARTATPTLGSDDLGDRARTVLMVD